MQPTIIDIRFTRIGKMPIDKNVRIGGDTGKPIVVSNPDSPAAKALRQIAESMAAMSTNNSLPINIVE